MSYFKDMLKHTKVFALLVFLSGIVSLPISLMLRELLQLELILSFVGSYLLGLLIVFSAFFFVCSSQRKYDS